MRVGATTIPPDALVLISLLAANRNGPASPIRTRSTSPARNSGHLAFGHGIHYCAGAPLARLEGQVAIARLLSRFPSMTLDGEAGGLRWRGSVLMHSLTSLPVRLA